MDVQSNANEPIIRVSDNDGKSFALPVLSLITNNTIDSSGG